MLRCLSVKTIYGVLIFKVSCKVLSTVMLTLDNSELFSLNAKLCCIFIDNTNLMQKIDFSSSFQKLTGSVVLDVTVWLETVYFKVAHVVDY